MKRECETCIKKKTLYCPTSMECMATDDMPYYQNRIMLLEENESLKQELNQYTKQLKKKDEVINRLKKYIENEMILDFHDNEIPIDVIICKLLDILKEVE